MSYEYNVTKTTVLYTSKQEILAANATFYSASHMSTNGDIGLSLLHVYLFRSSF